MIGDADLLQADATVIVGVLIFLTIRPISKGDTGKRLEKDTTLGSIYFTIFLLGISVYILLLGPTDLFYYSKVLTVAGIFVLLVPIIVTIIAPVVGTLKEKSGHGYVNDKK
ncbi:MAG: hypothetical protein ACJ72R_18960 [Nitrososphaeraceae archaeon]